MENALGAKWTDELAVMWDTFRPLRLTSLWREHDDPQYAYSWNPDVAGSHVAARGAEPSTDGSPERSSTVTGPSA